MIAGAVKRRSGPPYTMPTTAPYNVPVYCDVPTYDQTGSSLHFSVIDMHSEMGRNWRGWRYWACMTPYFRQNYRLENPSIIVSNDGFHWVLPNGIRNPVFPPPRNLARWNADGDIAYDPDSDQIVMLFAAADLKDGIGFARSRDGVSWPSAPGPVGNTDHMGGSPSIFRDTDGRWTIYSVWSGGTGSTGIRVMRRHRADHSGGPYSEPGVDCTGLGGMHADGMWHAEVLVDSSGIYRALVWAGWTSGHVYACSSTDGVAWSRTATPVLRPSGVEPSLSGLSRWDSSETYRGSFTEASDHWKVWYAGTPGGTTTDTSWRIGYTQLPKSVFPAPPA